MPNFLTPGTFSCEYMKICKDINVRKCMICENNKLRKDNIKKYKYFKKAKVK